MDVRLPDGRIIKNVPEGTTRAQLAAKLERNGLGVTPKAGVKGTGTYGLPAPKSDLTTSYLRGATFGGLDELTGVAGAMTDAIRAPFSDQVDFNPVKSYEAWKGRAREQAAATDRAHPIAGTALELAGGFGNFTKGAIKAASLPKQMLKGAGAASAAGGAAGFLGGEGMDRLPAAGWGALYAAPFGAAAPVVLPKLADMVSSVPGAVRSGVNYLRGQAPTVTQKGQGLARRLVAKAMADDRITPRAAGQAMQDAQARGVPLALGDLGDNLRGFTGSLSRKPGPARTLVRDMVDARQAGMGERIRGAVERDLGPIQNTFDAADSLTQMARDRSSPLYDKAYGVDLPASPEIDAILSTPAGKKALNRALSIAGNERVDPAKMGFAVDSEGNAILNPRSGVQSLNAAMQANPDRGYLPPVPDEYSALPAYTQKTANGSSAVRRRGPLDLVSWLRSRGGIRENGGELSHYGIDNKPRNLEFAKNEHFLGKLIDNERGMNLDDAALSAWEAGFFPNSVERPTVSEFLDALSATHSGSDRAFRASDLEDLNKFDDLRSVRGAIESGNGWEMRGEPVTLSDLQDIPLPSQADAPQVVPTYNTRALHYVKRGLDSVLEAQRDQFGRLNTSDDMIRTTNKVRADLLNELDRLNPDYRAARAVYAGPAAAREALIKGQEALHKTGDEIERLTAKMNGFERAQFASGFRAALADAIDTSGGQTDIVNKLLGTPKKRKALAKLFGGEAGLNKFLRTLADEKMAFETNRAIRQGSPTAERVAEDASADASLFGNGARAAFNTATGNLNAGAWNLYNALNDVRKIGIGKTAERARQEAAALLTETNPQALSESLREAMRQEAARRLRLRNQRAIGAGSGIGTGYLIGSAAGRGQ